MELIIISISYTSLTLSLQLIPPRKHNFSLTAAPFTPTVKHIKMLFSLTRFLASILDVLNVCDSNFLEL